MNRQAFYAWHAAINRFHEDQRPHRHWMYEAKTMAAEIPRLALIFGCERRGELSPTHHQCSFSPSEPVPDNHLTCCLGVECRACPELLAIEAAELTPGQKDEAKAWTCAAHILSSAGGDVAGEGYVLTTDDRMYWDRVYAAMREAGRG